MARGRSSYRLVFLGLPGLLGDFQERRPLSRRLFLWVMAVWGLVRPVHRRMSSMEGQQARPNWAWSMMTPRMSFSPGDRTRRLSRARRPSEPRKQARKGLPQG